METRTITLTESQIFQIQLALGDSAFYWYEIWRDCVSGKRTDISPEDASKMNRNRWELHELLNQE